MTDRNAPCPCGSGKKFKKCHGASAAAAQSVGSGAQADPKAPLRVAETTTTAEAAPAPGPPATDEPPFLIRTGRGLESERADAERKKHLRKRLQTSDLKGTLVYNSGAFYRPPSS